MDVCLIQVPYHAGDDRAGASRGPALLLAAGRAVIAGHGVSVSVATIVREGPFHDTAASSGQVNARLADAVGHAVAAGQLPVVLAGSCNSALGVLAGFEHGGCGAVWLDAHADFNTPESTESGFFPGMSAAIVTGHCYRDYWARIGDSAPIDERAVVMFGVRDLSPEAERVRLERSRIAVVAWEDGTPQRDVTTTLDELRRRVDDVYLHVDFDAFAPEVAPGIADDPVPGGLSLADAEAIVEDTAARFRIRAATLATYTPERDEDEKTLRVGVRLLDLLGEYAASV